MSPIIHCVRHGQGFHNVGGGCYTIPDPRLTPTGERQCESLRQGVFFDQSRISLVISSPMSRTLQTASLVFKTALMSTLKSQRIIAFPDAQETSSDLCDIGSDPDTLRRIVEEEKWPVDLSLVRDGWNQKNARSRYSHSNDAIRARARDTRLFLRELLRELVSNGDDDAEIVLVTHGGFLHYLTDDWEDSYRHPGTGWYNCETRAYVFESDFRSSHDEEAWLIETRESRWRRGKDYPMYGKKDQVKLFAAAMERWQGQGLQRPDEADLDLEVG
ncbi:histidine phosphatase superfamily [Aspergillus caelatus]|uniref:Histidine phosphatase superfamily n=1 Tax=Aspergillus caelatus TaxID=61420 RepID=A0A5N7ADM9_9EURO|nr:histidine phosphatase superfamily [Aspergillus caelatus]KAE8366730.1 histidine phosphatase superfamily [Aspergillus caelatus]